VAGINPYGSPRLRLGQRDSGAIDVIRTLPSLTLRVRTVELSVPMPQREPPLDGVSPNPKRERGKCTNNRLN